MAMSLTVSHMFLGAISIGIGLMRGTDAYAAFHHETNLGHANYGASKLAHDHGRSANIVVNDNVIMTAIMGPRMGVESDNITMDGNAMIACPTCPHGSICRVCTQYKQNKPRAALKQAWVRAKQQMLWSVLGKMNGQVDKLAFGQAQGLIKGDVSGMDPKVSVDLDDPSSKGDIWGGSAKPRACDKAKDDTLKSPVLGHAFPILISPNLLEGLPKTLVQAMPGMLCGGGMGGAGGMDAPSLPEIKSVSDKTTADCRALEDQLQSAISAAKGGGRDDAGDDIADLEGGVQLPSDVTTYVTCGVANASHPLAASGGGYRFRKNGQIVTCAFDRQRCADKQLEKNSDEFLRSALGLAKNAAGGMGGGIGSDEPRKPQSGGSSPKSFCACASTKKPIDDTVLRITDAVRKIASFGQVDESQALRQSFSYESCGKWYFPDKKGPFASVQEDDQPFVGAWKWALVKECSR